MSDLYLLLNAPIPDNLKGGFLNNFVVQLPSDYYISIEDKLFQDTNEQLTIPTNNTTAVCLKNNNTPQEQIDESVRLIEFSLALASKSNYIPVYASAVFAGDVCKHVKLYPSYYLPITPKVDFPDRLNGHALAQWISVCLESQKRLGNRMHVTVDRYLRYIRNTEDADGLLDLCISLESLIDAQTEISFRFSTCLAKVTGAKGERAVELAGLLSKLYDVRSKIVHGDPKAKGVSKKLYTNKEKLANLAREIMVKYVSFTSEKPIKEWKIFLQTALFT